MGLTSLFRKRRGTNTDVDLDDASSNVRSGFVEFFKDMRGTRKLAVKNELPLYTASVSFYVLFTACPLVVVCFLGAQYVVGGFNSPETYAVFQQIFEHLIPVAAPLVSENLIHLMKVNLATNILGVALLAWSTYELFTCLTSVFTKISVRGQHRNLLWSNAVSLMAFLIVVVGTSLFLILSATKVETLRGMLGPYLANVNLSAVRALSYAISFLLVFGSVTLIYKLMPTQSIKWIHAFRGAALFFTMFLVGRASYQIYIDLFRLFNETFYGSFLSFMIVVVWMYYLARIFLFSAQYAIYLEEKDRD